MESKVTQIKELNSQLILKLLNSAISENTDSTLCLYNEKRNT